MTKKSKTSESQNKIYRCTSDGRCELDTQNGDYGTMQECLDECFKIPPPECDVNTDGIIKKIETVIKGLTSDLDNGKVHIKENGFQMLVTCQPKKIEDECVRAISLDSIELPENCRRQRVFSKVLDSIRDAFPNRLVGVVNITLQNDDWLTRLQQKGYSRNNGSQFERMAFDSTKDLKDVSFEYKP